MILCCGEALIDMLPRVTAEGEAAFAPHAGGAVFNTAVALGRLGAPAGFFCGISTDMLGQILADRLAESGVDISHAPRSDRPTTIALVKLVDGQATYAFYDENTAARLLSPTDMPPPGAADCWFFGGISLVAEPCGAVYEALQAREAAAGAVTMIDPNIRPSFIRDEPAYRARIARMVGRADIVKLSDEDLHWLMGAGEIDDLARAVLAQGPKLVCITRGAEGAVGYARDLRVAVPTPRVTVADTVGAGDTFNAGVMAALDDAEILSRDGLDHLTEDQIRAALDLGARAAAVTVSRAGANPPRRDEL